MSARKKCTSLPQTPSVVGTIHSPGALRRALKLRGGQVDFLELRVDHFDRDPESLLAAIPRLAAPLIVTVRHPAEGGEPALSPARRRELYGRFMPAAAFIDVELRSCGTHRDVIESARAAGVGVIVSDHHFRSTPSLRALRARLQRLRGVDFDLFKLAARAVKPADLATLLAFLAGAKRPLSVMGMGPYGKVSRLLLARAGSLFNYGYLDQPQVPGQWEATTLKERIGELLSEH